MGCINIGIRKSEFTDKPVKFSNFWKWFTMFTGVDEFEDASVEGYGYNIR